MNKVILCSLLGSAVALPLLFSSAPVVAAEVKVTWENAEKYTDVRPANESRKRFRERTLAALEEHIVELASKLPESQKLTMTVTNVDLAGQVWPSQFVGFGVGAANDVRVIQRVDIPRMTFSYTLSDEQGAVISSAEEVQLKDMNFMESNIRTNRGDTLSYEKIMLEDWFNDTFTTNVAANEE